MSPSDRWWANGQGKRCRWKTQWTRVPQSWLSKAFRPTPAMNHVALPDFELVALPELSKESTKVSASQSWYF